MKGNSFIHSFIHSLEACAQHVTVSAFHQYSMCHCQTIPQADAWLIPISWGYDTAVTHPKEQPQVNPRRLWWMTPQHHPNTHNSVFCRVKCFLVARVQILPPTSSGRQPTAGGHPQMQLAPDMDGFGSGAPLPFGRFCISSCWVSVKGK